MRRAPFVCAVHGWTPLYSAYARNDSHLVAMVIKDWLKSQIVRIACVATHSVHPDFVPRGGTVLDCGANHGAFSTTMAGTFGTTCYLVEANPTLGAELGRTHARVLRAAVVGQSGPVQFVVRTVDDSSSLLEVRPDVDSGTVVEVEGVSFSDILRRFGISRVDVLKLDIEGAELGVLDAMTADECRAIGQITIEYHDEMGYYPREASAQSVDRLRRMGFLDFRLQTWSTLDVLLVNRRGGVRVWLEWLRVVLVTRPLLRVMIALQVAFELAGVH